ncbi:hypothetical protein MTR_5g083410 [Medicago truncatula]|uniref:Uncharacterized protein n=1 Tax=Medicago truncatula TaxID=3880 RepID=G7K785_MEDTR|nr:hypothetical protein MTR_5g083410 [Medicago truncatula]
MAEIETSKNGGSSGNTQELLGSDEEEDRYVASARKSTLKGDDPFFGPIATSLTVLNALTFISLQHNNHSGYIPNSWGGSFKYVFFRLQNLIFDHKTKTYAAYMYNSG